MGKQVHTNRALVLGLAGAVLGGSANVSLAGALDSGLANARSPASAMRAGATANSSAHTMSSGATTYSYTLIGYPGTLSTLGVGINLAAGGSGSGAARMVVGAFEFPAAAFPGGVSQTGFMASVAGRSPVAEQYSLLSDPGVPTPQQAYSINDAGTVVGDYIVGARSGAGTFHSYVMQDGVFRPLDVPFAGATGTFSPAINDRGEIVGGWVDSAGNEHSYTLINGTFTSFDVPGSSQAQFYYGINNARDITGSFADANGNVHGFLRHGDIYTQLDVPGAAATYPSGINDEGVIVGGYCPTTDCVTTGAGELGFVWTKGVYTTFSIAGEPVVGLASINDQGVILGNYLDAAGLIYTFLATPRN